MKYSILLLSLLIHFATYAMDESTSYVQHHQEKQEVRATVGQIIELTVYACNHWTNVFYTTPIKPAILKFVKEIDIPACNTNNMIHTVKVQYQALQKGTANVCFCLKAASLCKALGNVNYCVIVE